MIWLFICVLSSFGSIALCIVFWSKEEGLGYWLQPLSIMCIQPNCWTVNFFYSLALQPVNCFEWLNFVGFFVCVRSWSIYFTSCGNFNSCISASDPRKDERKTQNNSHSGSNQDAVCVCDAQSNQPTTKQNNGAILANNNWTNDSWSECDLNVSVRTDFNEY